MPHLRIAEAAALLGVSDDTVRRWISAESVPTVSDSAGRTLVDGADVARHAARASSPGDRTDVLRSARNRLAGIVTKVQVDGVMAQVDMQCGPHRIVSLMSAEAVRELRLEEGSLATAVVKATTVIVEASPKDAR
ncbi:TOBE domain-containing protein [Demequina capsici]|uniref:TOBE domain-containing protein n=1 Tax=Demequina capsici TaxID=3075620 RepID=A0AA96FBW9_9MICO|nr:TOBE domain-containing protein [Demequina sp. OYTSA14]WNM25460.1 TOBE domain-containing protein [Demequina sp. OYTSA14]